jgi:methionyl aminopeptidase
MSEHLRPGVTTGELDDIGRRVLEEQGARPAPALVYDFPGATCISVNEEVAHGIPGPRIIEVGDLVNIDVSAELDGYFADTGASIPVPPVAPSTEALCHRTRRALANALRGVRTGGPMNAVGKAVEREARRTGLRAIRNLSGHGVGRALHEEPREIANYFNGADPRRFSEGLVVAIETFLSAGSSWVVEGADGWTLKTADGSLAAQYEHTAVATSRGPVILTREA